VRTSLRPCSDSELLKLEALRNVNDLFCARLESLTLALASDQILFCRKEDASGNKPKLCKNERVKEQVVMQARNFLKMLQARAVGGITIGLHITFS